MIKYIWFKGMRNSIRYSLAVVAVTVAASCSGEKTVTTPPTTTTPNNTVDVRTYPRVYHSPYQNVNFQTDILIKAQMHDHVGVNVGSLRAYEAAGYTAVSLMDYSGVASLSYAWRERRWPPENWIPQKNIDEFKNSNLKLFIPNGEEVGLPDHYTSAFMTSYIAKWEPDFYPARQDWHYSNAQELIDDVAKYQGAAIIAHPSNTWKTYSNLTGYVGMEIYDAAFLQEFRDGTRKSNFNDTFLVNWDQALLVNPSVVGIAVNDHFGPNASLTTTTADVRDSGKILAWVPSITLESFEAAFRSGAVVAVKDLGTTKDKYARIITVTVTDSLIALVLSEEANVRWISNSVQVATGQVLDLTKLLTTAAYVRAEISKRNQHSLYTGVLVASLRRHQRRRRSQRTDVDVCNQVKTGLDRNPDHASACKAAKLI
jgi:hypothetical protein